MESKRNNIQEAKDLAEFAKLVAEVGSEPV
jgi:hypothetical protein